MKSNHLISMNAGMGIKVNEMGKAELWDAFNYLSQPSVAQEDKHKCVLIAPGYSATKNSYHRGNESFDFFSTIFIDCDNDEEHPHPNLMVDFKDAMKNYDYVLYETFSSTKECPKFRAIIPIDDVLIWSKYAREAISIIWKKWQDEAASWFFSPCKSKLGTIYIHDVGKEFPSKVIQSTITKVQTKEQMEDAEYALRKAMRDANGKNYEQRECDPYQLKKVKEYLEGSWAVGTDRRPRAHAAICAMMFKDVPPDKIREVLESGPLDISEFRDWLNQSIASAARYTHKIAFKL